MIQHVDGNEKKKNILLTWKKEKLKRNKSPDLS